MGQGKQQRQLAPDGGYWINLQIQMQSHHCTLARNCSQQWQRDHCHLMVFWLPNWMIHLTSWMSSKQLSTWTFKRSADKGTQYVNENFPLL